jgi:glycosyltransferase involved in cell wall biosynthesis
MNRARNFSSRMRDMGREENMGAKAKLATEAANTIAAEKRAAVLEHLESGATGKVAPAAPAASSKTEAGDGIELSVVMPCLNESATVGPCVKKALGTMQQHGISGEVIIADNGSTDGSQQIATAHGARVVPVDTRGYGSALRGGIRAARGRYVLMGDADDSYDFTQAHLFVNKLREGYDLVMGNRFKGGILPGAMPALHKYLGNPVLTGIGRLFFDCPVGDFHCGLRAFRREAIEGLGLRTHGMEFASEMVVKATAFGLRIKEIPTTLSPDGRDRAPHLRTWRDGWRHLRFLLLYSPRWLFLYPGMALFVLGAVISALLIPGPVMIGNVHFDINTLLFAAMAILIGFQSVVFAAFTKIFATSEGLLPEDPRLSRLFRYVTLEVGIVVGVLLVLAGTGAWGLGLAYWQNHHFGPLDPEKTLRIVIPGVVFLTLGFQVILSSFFLSVLGMSRR